MKTAIQPEVMNDKLVEPAKGLGRFVTRRGPVQKLGVEFAGIALATLLVMPASANDFKRGPLIALSDPDIFADCEEASPVAGIPHPAEFEPYIAVNPKNPKNLVTVWISGLFLGIGSAVSMDGGQSWQQAAIPGISLCTGGSVDLSFDLASDPWLSFAPNGDLYLICGSARRSQEFGNTLPPRKAIFVSKSTDGGRHWSSPTTVGESTDKYKLTVPDKPSICANPIDARYVYAVWNVLGNGNRGQAVLSRTTDGGSTWETARVIYDPGTSDSSTMGHQILVLPNGTLLDIFTEYKFSSAGTREEALFTLIRSTNQGQTWSLPVRVASLPVFDVVDPETGAAVVNASSYPPLFAVAVDQSNGNLYATWENTSFSDGQYSSIAFAMSSDGGFSWSLPIQVNKTPRNIPPGNQQAFLPEIAVASDGTVAVSYYDFRFNDPNPGLPTDCWLVHCHPSSTKPATDPLSWGNEVRLTTSSFNIESALFLDHGYFIGDYMGLATVGNGFVAVFNQSFASDPGTIFFRRVGP